MKTLLLSLLMLFNLEVYQVSEVVSDYDEVVTATNNQGIEYYINNDNVEYGDYVLISKNEDDLYFQFNLSNWKQ